MWIKFLRKISVVEIKKILTKNESKNIKNIHTYQAFRKLSTNPQL